MQLQTSQKNELTLYPSAIAYMLYRDGVMHISLLSGNEIALVVDELLYEGLKVTLTSVDSPTIIDIPGAIRLGLESPNRSFGPLGVNSANI